MFDRISYNRGKCTLNILKKTFEILLEVALVLYHGKFPLTNIDHVRYKMENLVSIPHRKLMSLLAKVEPHFQA